MAHQTGSIGVYHRLQERLDRNVTGAPYSPTFIRILKLLFSPEEAELARHIPTRLISARALAQKTGWPQAGLEEKLVEMAQRGLVFDIEHHGRRYITLNPVVIGFYEYTYMRTRDDLPLDELARLFEQYMVEDDRFARAVFQGQTQIGRSLVREEALPEGEHVEILDWERASRIVESATAAAVSLCACRHKNSHLGKACDRPQETCLTFNMAAKTLVRNGLARPVSTGEAMQILQESKELGLAQTADNVQRQVSYICNCCGCCCGMMQAIKRFDIRNAIVTSNWIMGVDRSRCSGCGKCVKACPVGALQLEIGMVEGKRRGWAVHAETLCLGCGVCYPVCKEGALSVKPRDRRVFTPETIFDRILAMAIERGKLADLIFEAPDRLSQRALRRIVGAIEGSPPFQAAIAVAPLKSAFLGALVKVARRG